MKQTLTLERWSAPDHFIFWKLRTVSDKSHRLWGIVTGNYSGQDARAAGDSNHHRRPGDSLGAHEAPVPLSSASNIVIQRYTFSRVSVPSKNSRRRRRRPRARRPCRCPPPPFDPPRIATLRHRQLEQTPPRNDILPSSLSIATLSPPACLAPGVTIETLPPRHLDHKFLRALGAETTSPAQPQAQPPPPPPSSSLASVGQYERVGEMDPS